jgi:hypothetical protein
MDSKFTKFAGFTLLLLISNLAVNAQFRVFATSDMVRVFEDGYKMPLSYDTLSLFGIRGETLSGQFVMNSKNEINNVTVEVSPLKNESGEVLTGTVVWNFVGSVPLSKNAPNQPKGIPTRVAPALFPDYLMEERQMQVKANSYQSVWLTAKIPATAPAGHYSGNVTVKSSEGSQSLPVCLKIYPLTLPSERHLKVTEWYTTNHFAEYQGIKEMYSPEWFGMLKKYAENMADHRQNVFQVPMSAIAISRPADGALEFDFSQFDKIAQVFWDTKRMDYLETGEPAKFVSGGFASTAIALKEFPVKDTRTGKLKNIPGEEVLPYLLPAFESHLRQKGWLKKTLFHIKDEPSNHNALSWIDISSYVHKYAPELIRMDAVCTSYLFGNIEIAVPKLDHMDAGSEIYRKGQRDGTELWFYTVGIFQANKYPNKTIDMPLIDSRILHWINYKYDLTGYLHWGWNQWTGNPFSDTGEHIGDAWHVYPVKDGVLNSLRWEQMRNGIQDYEYFRMLQEKVECLKDSLGSAFAWIDPEQRSKEIITRVVSGMKDHSDDPALLCDAKKEVIHELMDFNTSPRIYVQTNPTEHGTVMNRSVVELIGWVEDGTEIAVNGVKLPVAGNGMFMERYIVYVGDKLEIKATKDRKTKVITRYFNVTN